MTETTAAELPAEPTPLQKLQDEVTALVDAAVKEQQMGNFEFITGRPILDFFLIPMQEQDILMRKLRKIVTENRIKIIKLLNAVAADEAAKAEAAKVEAAQLEPTDPKPAET